MKGRRVGFGGGQRGVRTNERDGGEWREEMRGDAKAETGGDKVIEFLSWSSCGDLPGVKSMASACLVT